MIPLVLYLFTVERDRPEIGVCVVAATEDGMRILVSSVEICHACKIALTTVAIAGIVFLSATVVPIERTCGLASRGLGTTVRFVKDGVESLSRESFEHREELISTIHSSITIAPILGVANGLYGGHRTCSTDIVALSVLASRSRLAHHFGTSVTIEIVDHELGVVCSGTDVHPKIHAPQSLCRNTFASSSPIHLIAIEIDLTRLTTLRIVFCI